MGIFSRLFGREERAAINIENGEASGSAPEALLLSALVGDDKINENTALEIPALSAAVDFIADTIAMLPIKLYRENAAEKRAEEVTNDPRVFLLNDETGDLLGAVDAKRAQVRDMLIYGSGYMFINRVGNNVESLHYVKHGDVSVNINSDPIFKAAKFMVGGSSYYPWDFITLTRNTANGVTGRGLVDEHDTILSATYNTLKYENVISRTGGNKKGFLQSEKPLSEPRIRELRDTWNELYANNNNSMMVLNSGIKYTPSASTSVEMQLNQNKLTNAEQIALLLRLSADVLSGKGDTAQYMSSVRTAVLPIIATYTAALNRALLLESEKRDMYFAFDTTELLKGDTLTRYQAYAVGLQNNFLQLDDVRYAEDLPKLGVNYIKLGLQDVLLDPKTGIIYTPNTNAAANMSNMGQLGENGLTDGEDGGVIEERARHYIRGEHGHFMGSVSDGNNGGSASGGGKISLDKSAKSGIIKLKDDFIGRSLSAKAKNYDVFDPSSGETFHFAEGTKIQNREVFAGYGTRIPLHNGVAEGLTEHFKSDSDKWQHVKGIGVIDYFGEERKAEVHWFQEESVGQVKHKIKRWLE